MFTGIHLFRLLTALNERLLRQRMSPRCGENGGRDGDVNLLMDMIAQAEITGNTIAGQLRQQTEVDGQGIAE